MNDFKPHCWVLQGFRKQTMAVLLGVISLTHQAFELLVSQWPSVCGAPPLFKLETWLKAQFLVFFGPLQLKPNLAPTMFRPR